MPFNRFLRVGVQVPPTLRRYLRILRDYAVLIAVVTAVAGASSILHVRREKEVYEARTSIAFQYQDPADLDISATPGVSPGASQLAIASAQRVSGPEILARVKRSLKTDLSPKALSSAIRAAVPPNAGVLVITARSTNARFAARLADAVASEVVILNNRRARAGLAPLLRAARREIVRLRKNPGLSAPRIARLESLREFARLGEIPRPAPATVGKVSRQPVRRTVFGIVFGLLAGVLTAFVGHALDRRLRRERDVQAHFGLPVLGHVRNQTLGRVVRVEGDARGAREVEELRKIRGNLEFLDRDSPSRSILVTSALPEEGKSTLAGCLAFVMAASGKRTLLVECDLRRPALAARLGVEPTPGLTDFLSGDAGIEEIVRSVPFGDPSSTAAPERQTDLRTSATTHVVAYIPAGSPTASAAELLGSTRFADVLLQVSEGYEAVLLDSSPLLPVADTLALVPQVDAVIVCGRVGQITRDQALAARATLAIFPPRPMGLVVTGAKAVDEPAVGRRYTNTVSPHALRPV